MSVAAIRTALATAVTTLKDEIPNWKVTEKVPDQINPPQAVVYRNTVLYDRYLGDDHGDDLNFGVMVYAQRTPEDKAQELLDKLVEPTGTTSMKVAIETSTTLKALCSSVGVLAAGPVMRTTVGTVDYLTVEFTVEIED